jgi:hypothetical protein
VLRFVGFCAVPRGGALQFFVFMVLSIILLISHPRLRLGGFLMTAAPNRGGQIDKTFWKKIRPPPRRGVEIFFQKPVGPGLGDLTASLEICSQKAPWREWESVNST